MPEAILTSSYSPASHACNRLGNQRPKKLWHCFYLLVVWTWGSSWSLHMCRRAVLDPQMARSCWVTCSRNSRMERDLSQGLPLPAQLWARRGLERTETRTARPPPEPMTEDRPPLPESQAASSALWGHHPLWPRKPGVPSNDDGSQPCRARSSRCTLKIETASWLRSVPSSLSAVIGSMSTN